MGEGKELELKIFVWIKLREKSRIISRILV